MNFTLNVNVTGLEGLVSVLERLLASGVVTPQAQAPAPVQSAPVLSVVPSPAHAPQGPVYAVEHANPVAPMAPTQMYQTAGTAAMAPAPVAPAPAVVPVAAAPSYDMNQLAVAATQLMDAGRQPELINLLASFGVQALTQLPKEQYGNFATQLRAMGAKI